MLNLNLFLHPHCVYSSLFIHKTQCIKLIYKWTDKISEFMFIFFKFQDKPEIVQLGKILKNIIVLTIEHIQRNFTNIRFTRNTTRNNQLLHGKYE
jgi:hypothetical protein